ncbi:yeats family-domain-containing protein [Xylariaceae sp. FL0255]|nr:yeats family-domain-containing protein [Xylariaceae sp. FL0255]
MAPPTGKRVKGVQVSRPFIYGTTARPFNDTDNPRPADVPVDHTHSWQVFVRGVEDTDIFYWLRRVQFKLHESIPNHLRTIDAETIIKENEAILASGGKSSAKKIQRGFVVNETGWGEFEITIKLYYDSKSSEKPQQLYHHLRLHPYGKNEAEKEAMRTGGEVQAWTYEEQLFNEPFEDFYKILTTGARDKGAPVPGGKGGKGKSKNLPPPAVEGDVKERSAMIPLMTRPGQPFSRDTEAAEIKRLVEAQEKVNKMILELNKAVKAKETELAEIKESNSKNNNSSSNNAATATVPAESAT